MLISLLSSSASCVSLGSFGSKVLGTETTSLHTKVLQVEAAIGVLVEDTQAGRYNWVFGEIPTSLFALESTTARNTAAALHLVMGSTPDLRNMAQDFKFSIRHTCSDKYAANVAAERIMTSDYPELVFSHTFCAVHRLFTCTAAAMSSADADVTGLLNLALATGRSGSVAGLQQTLSKILAEHLVIRYEAPPADHETVTYRNALFDACLPLEGPEKYVNSKRRFVIERLLNGRLQTDTIEHFCEWGCCPAPEYTLRCMAVYLTWALIPHQLPKFPRSRWTRWDRSLSWTGLLAGTHNLLPLVMASFLGDANVPIQAVGGAGQDAAPVLQLADDWEGAYRAAVDSDSDSADTPNPELAQLGQEPQETLPEEERPVEGAEPGGGEEAAAAAGNIDWAAFWRDKRMKARLWVKSMPFARLMVMKETAVLLLAVMSKFLLYGGAGWQKRQEARAARGQSRSYPISEAAENRDVLRCMEQLYRLLGRRPAALLEDHMTPEIRFLRFAIVSGALCSLHILLRVPRQGFPFRLFRCSRDSDARS